MMPKPRVLWLLCCLLSAALGAPHAKPSIKPLSQLKAGMKGQGRTVVRGLEIERFDFEILDVLETTGFANNLILIRASGPLIDKAGGIAAGMSGSPLFIGDDLIGAVAFTTPMSDTHFAYATPIEDMLKVLAFETRPHPVAQALRLDRLPVGTPLLVSGVTGRSLDLLRTRLRRLALPVAAEPQPIGAPDPAPPPGGFELTEGSAVAASLATGDIVLTALGTLTYRDGDTVLAFGHPFLQRGDTGLFLHPAFIYGVVPSINLPFKIGAPAGPPIGAFVEDRSAGLAGRLGRAAPSVELSITARDSDLQRERTINTKLIRDPELQPTLLAVCLQQAIDEVMDRSGGGTAEMKWSIAADGLPEPLVRQDMVYSAGDIVAEAVGGPLFCLDALLRNDFAAITPQKISVSLSVSPTRRTLRLIDVRANTATVKPGRGVTLLITLQPYRGQAFQRTMKLIVPADTPPGRLVIEVHGRPETAAGPLSQAALLARGLTPPASLEELLKDLAGTQRGNSLIAELLTPEAAALRQQSAERLGALPQLDLFSEELPALPTLGKGADHLAGRPLAKAEVLLDRVIQGRLRAAVTVSEP